MRVAIVGDIHGHWTSRDTAWFDQAGYDALLFVGDLPTYRLYQVYGLARQLARSKTPAYFMPGNHDATTLRHLIAEVAGFRPRLPGRGLGMQLRMRLLERSLGDTRLCGYSWHRLDGQAMDIGLICGRPHSMGGGFNFGGYIERRFNVRTLEESGARLCEIVDECPCEHLLFMGHNGPAGLGASASDIWGCDFKKEEGDWGDPDLRVAIDHALGQGRRVLAVVAGHMHQRTKHKTVRTWHVERDGTHFINAARVPRIFKDKSDPSKRLHHHVALTLDAKICHVEERLITLPA